MKLLGRCLSGYRLTNQVPYCTQPRAEWLESPHDLRFPNSPIPRLPNRDIRARVLPSPSQAHPYKACRRVSRYRDAITRGVEPPRTLDRTVHGCNTKKGHLLVGPTRFKEKRTRIAPRPPANRPSTPSHCLQVHRADLTSVRRRLHSPARETADLPLTLSFRQDLDLSTPSRFC